MQSSEAAEYTRISLDREGLEVGVDRQHEDNLALAERHDLTIVASFSDNDIGASTRTKKTRPSYDEMMRRAWDGEFDAIVAYSNSRLTRRPMELEGIIQLFEHRQKMGRPLRFLTMVSGEDNLATADGRMVARFKGVADTAEAERTGERVARAHRASADQGKALGHRPFGWKKDKVTLDPSEAAHVKAAIERLFAGDSFSSVVRDWNRSGVRTAQGNEWTVTTFKNYLKNPRLYGARTYKREVHVDKFGQPVMGAWEPLLDEETYDRLQLIVRPSGKRKHPGARKFLLSGVLRCGVCNGRMYGNSRNDGSYFYACHKSESANTHSVSIAGVRLDKMVSDLVVAYVAQGPEVAPQSLSDPFADDIQAKEEQIAELMQAFQDGTLTAKRVFPMVEAIEKELAEMQQGRDEWLARTTVPASAAIGVDEWSEEMSDAQRRAYVERVFDAIYVKPRAEGSARVFDPRRVSVVWRDPA
jgi:DNA invertase Pin-like site-specific DNA recombinase